MVPNTIRTINQCMMSILEGVSQSLNLTDDFDMLDTFGCMPFDRAPGWFFGSSSSIAAQASSLNQKSPLIHASGDFERQRI